MKNLCNKIQNQMSIFLFSYMQIYENHSRILEMDILSLIKFCCPELVFVCLFFF